MCGILGYYSLRPDLDVATLQSMLVAAQNTLHNRGPDDRGLENFTIPRGATKSQGHLFLGHTRLSIIDLSKGGHQPMHSESGRYVIVFNGEIYNYRELREELKTDGYVFQTDSDTEVLLACWERWGITVLPRLIGMFAFVVFDRRKQALTLVRDAFGIKPIFYSLDDKNIGWASELPALLKLLPAELKLNLQQVYDYLVNGLYDNQPQTFFEGVKHLLPGHWLEVDLKTMNSTAPKRWWNPSTMEKTGIKFADAAEQLRELFLKNIRLHLRSDVPTGAALSGGIDSSSIICAVRYLEPKAEINSFSYIAKGSSVSEEKWIDFINDYTGAKSYKVTSNDGELLKDLDDLIETQNEPFGSTSIYAQYRVFHLAKKNGVKVTLDGQGADELLAGYFGYPMQKIQSLLERDGILASLSFANQWQKWPGRSNNDAYKYLGAGISPNFLRPLLKRIFIKTPEPNWLNIEYLEKNGVVLDQKFLEQSDSNRGRRVIETLAHTLSTSGLQHLLRHGDRNSMRFSVESRVPFLTPEMANFLLTLPEDYLISNKGETKRVFRAAMRGIVPDKILDRKDKIGFETPEKLWLTSMAPTLRKWIENASDLAFINKHELLMEFDSIISGQRAFSWQVWRWINFLRWVDLMKIKSNLQIRP